MRSNVCFQPPKEKAEEETHAGLTTLFPGQKRRVSHLSKPGKEVRRMWGHRAGIWRKETCYHSLPEDPCCWPSAFGKLVSSAPCPIQTACP